MENSNSAWQHANTAGTLQPGHYCMDTRLLCCVGFATRIKAHASVHCAYPLPLAAPFACTQTYYRFSNVNAPVFEIHEKEDIDKEQWVADDLPIQDSNFDGSESHFDLRAYDQPYNVTFTVSAGS